MGQIFIDNTVGTKEDPELIKKETEYLNYIDEHVNNVVKAFAELFINIKDEDIIEMGLDPAEFKAAKRKASKNVGLHDASKYEDEEFYAYRAHFHKTKMEEEKISNDRFLQEEEYNNFQRAWEHHYKNNWHHPNAWVWLDPKENGGYTIREVARSEALEMPLEYIIEMLCDWHAMDIKFNTKLSDWYNSDRSKEEREIMHPSTKSIVDKMVEWVVNHKE